MLLKFSLQHCFHVLLNLVVDPIYINSEFLDFLLFHFSLPFVQFVQLFIDGLEFYFLLFLDLVEYLFGAIPLGFIQVFGFDEPRGDCLVELGGVQRSIFLFVQRLASLLIIKEDLAILLPNSNMALRLYFLGFLHLHLIFQNVFQLFVDVYIDRLLFYYFWAPLKLRRL